jgi:hypothetical protein
MIGSFFVLYIYNPFQVKAVGPTSPKLQIQQGLTLEGFDLIIFNNFVFSTARARGAQLGIILNFVFYYAAQGAQPRHASVSPCTSATSTTSSISSVIQPRSPRLLPRHHLLKGRLHLDHLDYFDYYTRSFSHEHQPRGAGLHWKTSTSSLSGARERV